MSRPPRRTALAEPAGPPPAPPVEATPHLDMDREERLHRMMVLWGAGHTEQQVIRDLCREFAITPEQARKDLADLREHLRARMDDEGVIDEVMFRAAARANEMANHLVELALRPIPERTMATPDNDPDNPLGPGATYRPLSPSEQSALINAKAAAARASLAALDFQTKLLGKRSPRWADKPPLAVNLTVGKDGLTEDDRKLLRDLGMAP